MLAATAAADFTPPVGLVLQGHAGSPPSHTVLYPLEARSIVFADGENKVGICTLDVIGVEKDVTHRVRQRVTQATGIPGDHLMIATSHTHCAPAAIKVLGMTPDADFMQAMEDAIVNTLIEAAGALQPVTLGLGCGQASFNINRRPVTPLDGTASPHMSLNFGGIADRRARILRVDKEDGSPLAVLFHYSCHPTTKGGGQGKISPDYPGIARRHIEAKLGCHALYMPGCFGNIRPAIFDADSGGFGDATDEQLEACGVELGDGVVSAAKYVRTLDATGLSAKTIDINMLFGEPMPLADIQAMAVSGGKQKHALINARWAKIILEKIESGTMPASEPSQMQAMRIGPLQLITIPGEAVQEIGLAVEKAASAHTDADDIWAAGYSNDMLGYLTTQRQKAEGGYEPNAYVYFDRPARFNNELDTIVDGAKALLGAN